MSETLTSDLHQDAWDTLQLVIASIISVIDDYDPQDVDEHDEDEIYDFYFLMHKPSMINDLKRYADSMMKALENKDVVSLRADFDFVVSICEELSIYLGEEFEEVESCLDLLSVSEGTLIYLPKHDVIYTPQLILDVHSELIKLIARQPNLIFEISPRQFEEIIAELFFKKGFEVELTKQTRDGGRDIVAIRKEMDVKTKYLIECKRYALKRNVSIGVVQRLLGVKVAESANKAILATTSGFTRDARKFAHNHLWDLDLKDHHDIMSWIKAH